MHASRSGEVRAELLQLHCLANCRSHLPYLSFFVHTKILLDRRWEIRSCSKTSISKGKGETCEMRNLDHTGAAGGTWEHNVTNPMSVSSAGLSKAKRIVSGHTRARLALAESLRCSPDLQREDSLIQCSAGPALGPQLHRGWKQRALEAGARSRRCEAAVLHGVSLNPAEGSYRAQLCSGLLPVALEIVPACCPACPPGPASVAQALRGFSVPRFAVGAPCHTKWLCDFLQHMLKKRQLNEKLLKEIPCIQVFWENQSRFHSPSGPTHLLRERGKLQGTAVIWNVPLLG